MSYTYKGSATQFQGSGSSITTSTSLTVSSGDLIVGALQVSGNSVSGITLSDGSNTYFVGPAMSDSLPEGNGVAGTFTAAPSGTSAILTAAFTGTTGSYNALFSDGEVRNVGTLTNGTTTAISWSGTTGLCGGALTGTPTTAVTFFPVAGNNIYLPFYAYNCASGTYAITATCSNTINGIVAANYSGIATSNPYIGGSASYYSSGTSGPNVMNSGNITISQNAMIWGFALNTNAPTTGIPLVGTTLSFTARSSLSWNTNPNALTEDAATSTTAAAVFGSQAGFDYYSILGMAFLQTLGNVAKIAWIV